MTSRYIPQLSFSFYRHRAIRADFSGGQITTDAGLLPLRAFDQQYGLTRGLAERVCDERYDSRVSHPGLSLLRQRHHTARAREGFGSSIGAVAEFIGQYHGLPGSPEVHLGTGTELL